jgi:hypothetical protein
MIKLEDATIQIPLHNFFEMRVKETKNSFKKVFVNPYQCFQMIFHTPVVRGLLRLPRVAYKFQHKYAQGIGLFFAICPYKSFLKKYTGWTG